MLDFNNLRDDTFLLQNSKFKISNLMSEIFQLFEPESLAKKINLLIQYRPNKLKNLELYNDKNRIKSVLIHLIGNSAKFTFHGDV